MSATEQPADVNLTPVTSAVPSGADAREFDPTPYLRQIRGRGGQASDYLDVRHRLLWLRTMHPDAMIVTELIRADERLALFKASVAIPGGGSATGHGSESVSDFADYVEKAETKALGRALNALGFGVQFAELDTEEPRLLNGRSPALEADRTRPMREPRARAKGQEWTLFWEWAKSVGFGSQSDVEVAIGKSMSGLSPAELQNLLTPLVQRLGATA